MGETNTNQRVTVVARTVALLICLFLEIAVWLYAILYRPIGRGLSVALGTAFGLTVLMLLQPVFAHLWGGKEKHSWR